MDSQTTSPATSEQPDPLAATLHNATIDKAEGNEFSNTARDMFKIVLNYHNNSRSAGPTGAGQTVETPMPEFHDAINLFLNAVPLFIQEVRKNDQSRSTIGETPAKDNSDPVPQAVTTSDYTPHSSILEDPVNVIDIVPTEPSSLPVTSIADRYTRSMLGCLRGYPLYNPKPFCDFSTECLRNGINVGDVGFVRESGTFDCLFNICPSQNRSINPSNLPDEFSLETPDHLATTHLEPLPRNTRLFQSPITRTKSGEYICEGSEGAVLELPKGASQDEAMNRRPFAKFAAHHGVQWYEYTMNRGRDISNGSLYLITSFTKCTHWGIAVFDRPCAPGQGLRFDKKKSLPFRKSTSEYHWKGSGTFPTNVSSPDQGDAANQCVFVRGYKIMIRQDIFDNLCNDQPRESDSATPSSSPQAGSISMTRRRATRIRGGGGPDPGSRLTSAALLSWNTVTKSDEEVVLHPNFNPSLVHPSDLINAALLSQNPGAKVALTHDDVWCDLLRDNFPKLNYATLINIARSYTNAIEYDCVSLEKTSDPSNVLDESSHPLQGTRTPASQEPFTSPVDNHILVPATISLTLPHELVERILLLLDTEFMLKCRLVNREFNVIVQSSPLVQYYLACKAASVIDNPQSPLIYTERLEALRKREDAWRKLKPVFEATIQPDDQPWTLLELEAGNFFLSDKNGKDLYYCRLPSSPQDNPRWSFIPGRPGQSWSGSIITVGMALYEHDLVVNVISSEVRSQEGMQRHSLDLVFLTLSTREYHPLARRPLIHIRKSSSDRPYTLVKIAGDNLALVVHDEDGSNLFIFDWKTGHKRLQHKATENAYDRSVPVFVSPELLIVPNCVLSRFEVWHLFPPYPNTNLPVQILCLQLPAISNNYSIFSIVCHGGPTPFLHPMPYFPPQPFFPCSGNSIIIVSLRLQFMVRRTYTLVMHRYALVDMIQKWTLPSLLEQQEGPPTWLTNEVIVHAVSDPDDGSVTLAAQSESVLTTPHPAPSHGSSTLATAQKSPTTLALHTSTDSASSSTSSGSASSTSRYNILQVQWADWGPPISRWLRLNECFTAGFSQSAGQRLVFLDSSPRDKGKSMVAVADFNLHNVRRNDEMMAQLRGKGEDNGGNGNNGEGKEEENEEEWEILDVKGVFLEKVYMGLKCVIYHVPGEYHFDAVLMDEERLLGLKHDRVKKVESIKVLYIG